MTKKMVALWISPPEKMDKGRTPFSGGGHFYVSFIGCGFIMLTGFRDEKQKKQKHKKISHSRKDSHCRMPKIYCDGHDDHYYWRSPWMPLAYDGTNVAINLWRTVTAIVGLFNLIFKKKKVIHGSLVYSGGHRLSLYSFATYLSVKVRWLSLNIWVAGCGIWWPNFAFSCRWKQLVKQVNMVENWTHLP